MDDSVKKILFITMSNLGDAFMGLPAFDFLRRVYPAAAITVVAAPRTACVFERHPDVSRLIVFDKHGPLQDKIRLFFDFKKEGFDVIIDLKNTFYGWVLPAYKKTPKRVVFPPWVKHSVQKHLYKTVGAIRGFPVTEDQLLQANVCRNPSFFTAHDWILVKEKLLKVGIKDGDRIAVVAPGALSYLKRWTADGFAQVVRGLVQTYRYKVILVGTSVDADVITEVLEKSQGEGVVNLCGQTDFRQMCALVWRSDLVICNDSGVLHIASYLERPVVGIYGPSDPVQYGPWSKEAMAVHKQIPCFPCEKASCQSQRQCLEAVRPYDVLLAVKTILQGETAQIMARRYRRILVVRTDRIGDVLLSTPVFKSLRDHFPSAMIGVMVTEKNRELVDGNPYVDQVISFDKENCHAGVGGSVRLAAVLRRLNFDLAIILHPALRVHLVCFLAGIPQRVGYDYKGGFFLTTRVSHRKHLGEKHESEYNFDLLSPLGISQIERQMYMPVTVASEKFAEDLWRKKGLMEASKIFVVNPSSSCVSKRWPVEKFAQLIDNLSQDKVRCLVVSDESSRATTEKLKGLVKQEIIDLTGQLSLSQLGSVLRRSDLLVSNDSGPVHMAVALGVPVISIFSRSQPGLSPSRWRPLGSRDVVFHKKTDCSPCLAHDCRQGFKCLEAIDPAEVTARARDILFGQSRADASQQQWPTSDPVKG